MKSKKLQKTLAIILALGMLISTLPISASAQGTIPTGPSRPIVERSTLLNQPQPQGRDISLVEELAVDLNANEPARYVVILEDKPLATYQGGVAGLNGTAPLATGVKLDVNSPESLSYLQYLENKQDTYLTTATNVLGFEPEVLFRYQYATNGFSMMLTPTEAVQLAEKTGAKVLLAPIETLHTDEGPELIGAPAIWDGETSNGVGTYGEGVVVGIIDTGINFDHPSFSDTPADGHVYPTPAKYFGVCDPSNTEQYNAAYDDACNDKVIGAFTYVKSEPEERSTPEDSEGHGSHTASTVAGNIVEVEYQGVNTTISGVAPHAQIIAFDVCVPREPNGACFGDATVMAVDDAIANGVDVINYSISGGANPYSDPVELAFLAATEAGIFVSTSAGNSGDTTGESSVAHRSPWVSTVAASSHGRIFANAVDITGPGTVPVELTALGAVMAEPVLTADLEDLPIKYSASNVDGCDAFPAGYFTGAIAVIQRGTCNFSVKEENAYAAGASYVLIFNSRTGAPAGMAGIVTGAAMISMEDGEAILDWIDANPTATASISAETSRIYNANYEDIVAGFSSYGPNTTFDVLKPDITAPGVSILAAVADGTIAPSSAYEIDLYQGTSMSSPHNAGAAALMMALHPTWTPMEIRSAMMMTAQDGLLADRFTIEGVIRDANPQDEGSGRVALENAALVGLVMNETVDNFEAADPALGGVPSSLNLASLYSSKCVGECTWTRTFTSVSNLPATYIVNAPDWVTVTPASFTINPGATQEITITADVAEEETDEWLYGSIEFLTDSTFAGSGAPDVILSESFDLPIFPPTGWTTYNLDGGGTEWAWTATDPHSGDGSAVHMYSTAGNQDGWLVSPSIAITSGQTFSFWEKVQYPSYYGYHGLMISTGSCDPADDEFTELEELDGVPAAWTMQMVDLSSYAGQSACLAFNYQGNDASNWRIDDVLVQKSTAGEEVADVHIPLAVLPTSSNIPSFVKFTTHRDADSASIDDLTAVEITDGNTWLTGLTVADLETFTLDPDPTNGDPIDDTSQVFVKKFDVPAYTIRLVAEITATTSLDLDMFLYYDLDGDGVLTSEDYLVAQSATATAFEYINGPKNWIFYNQPDTFFIVVQNWSGAVGDTVTLASAMVPAIPEAGNYEVVLPATNPAGEPFSMDIFWDEDTSDGDRMYGYFESYADSDGDIFIGGTDIDIVRQADDVGKTADVTVAEPGDVITYSITITNFTSNPIEYDVSDTLPAGVTYVPGSVTGGATYDAGTNTIAWSDTVDAAYRDYVATTSAEDPYCSLAILTDGNPTDAYLDLFTTSYNFKANAPISGDSFWYGSFSTYAPFNFYGVDYVGMQFTADGLAGWPEDISANNTSIPVPGDPNNIMALFWDDLVVQYNLANNYGVTLVGDTSSFAVIEYDDVQLKADSSKTMDMEVGFFLQPDDTPGAYEIVFAYDNITPGFFATASGTIGVENEDASAGTLFSYNDTALSIENGSAICFDWAVLPAPPVVITYQVTVEEYVPDGDLTNIALHDNDHLGTVNESATATVAVTNVNDAPVANDQSVTTPEDTAKEITLVATDLDGNPLTYIIVDEPEHGSLSDFDGNKVTYTPDEDYYGPDSFTFKANDSTIDSNVATVSITVTSVNDWVTANDDAYETLANVSLVVVEADGVLKNDVLLDPDEEVSVEILDEPQHGDLTMNDDGSFTYVPDTGFMGIDSFRYLVLSVQNQIHGGPWSDFATVTILVKPQGMIYLPVILK